MKQQVTPRDTVNLKHSTGIAKPFKMRSILTLGTIFITVFTLTMAILVTPNIAIADTSTSHTSISHYVTYSTSAETYSALSTWAQADASREDPMGDNNSCLDNYYGKSLITVLDFGQINPSGSIYGADNWNNGWYSFWTIQDFAYNYALDYYSDAGVCSHLTVAIGVNNSFECSWANYSTTCINDEGQNMAINVNYAETHIKNNSDPDFALQVSINGGDDIENDAIGANQNWDSYNQTANFLLGYAAQGSQYLWDYGASFPCGPYQQNSNCGSGQVYNYWDYGEVYMAAWGIGKDMPLPEAYYGGGWGQYWGQVYANTQNGCPDCFYDRFFPGKIAFQGVMNNDSGGWTDPNRYYTNFWNSATSYGGVWPSANYFDTCMPFAHDDSNTPCY